MIAEPQKIEKTPRVHEEIIELEKKLSEKKQELLEKEGVEKSEKELIKEVLKEKTEWSGIPRSGVSVKPSSHVLSKASEIKEEPKERQVQLLIELAFEKGISHAVEVAKQLDNPYLLDEFHDTLVDELYNKLVGEGKLEKI